MFRVLLFVIYCGHAIAQETMDSDSISMSVDMEEFVITAQYEPTHYREASHKVDIIQKAEIDRSGFVSLDQVLTTHPAVRITYDPVLGSTIRMRGMSGRNVAILMDGIPVIGRLNGNIDMSQINLANVERIEIIEGALSNIYGNNAAGGVINLITNKRHINQWKGSVSSQIESIKQQTYNASLGYGTKDVTINASGRLLNYMQYAVDSFRLTEKIILDGDEIIQTKYPWNPKKQYGIGAMIRINPTDNSSLIVKYDYNKERVVDYGIIKRPRYKPYAQDDYYHTARKDYTLQYKNTFDKSYIELKSSYNDFDRSIEKKRYYIETDSFDNALTRIDSTNFSQIFNRVVFSHEISKYFKGIVGTNYTYEKGSGDRIVDNSSEDSTTASFYEIAPFFELKYKPTDQLKIAVSGRYNGHSVYTGRFTPAFHTKYDIDDDWNVRLSYAQGYRSPSLKELYLEFIDINHFIIGNPDLTPEVSHDYQLALTRHHKKYESSVSIYHTSIQNMIGLVQFENLKFKYDNINKYNVYGFKPEFSVNIDDMKIESSLSYSFWATNIKDDDAPTHSAVLDLSNQVEYMPSFVSGLGVMINHRYVGNQIIYRLRNEEVTTATIDGYHLLNLGVNKSFHNNKVRINVGVNNVLDVGFSNVSNGNEGSAHGGSGRNVVNRGRSYFCNLSISI